MFELIFMNVAEFVVIALFFAFIGRITEFLVSAGVLLSIRLFSGGFHLKKFRYCFILTFSIFVFVILLLPNIYNIYIIMEVLLLISGLLIIILAPVSKRNVAHTKRNNLILKIFSVAILLAHSFWIINQKDGVYASIATWMIFIQSIQLIIGRGLIQYEKTINEKQLVS